MHVRGGGGTHGDLCMSSIAHVLVYCFRLLSEFFGHFLRAEKRFILTFIFVSMNKVLNY
jgi:hypothetical protein